MPKVTFMPAGLSVDVAEGTLIHEAAVKAGLSDLHLPCGAKGTCGKCLVEVTTGSADTSGQGRLAPGLESKGLVLACRSKVKEDLTVVIRSPRDIAMRVVGDSHLLVGEDILPEKEELSPLYRSERLTVPPASIEEHYSDWQRLAQEITRGSVPVRAGIGVLRELAEALRADSGRVTATLMEDESGVTVLGVEAGHAAPKAYGIAADIGTTTVAVQLIDLESGAVVSNGTSYNAQVGRGADVISRIDYARTPQRLKELRGLVLGTLNTLIKECVTEAGISAQEIHAAFVAGNTTMIHLFLGLPPRYIRETPYVPTVNAVPSLTAGEVGLDIDPRAAVACAPGVGSYVGGDITAGLLCTEFTRNREEVFLYLDIGTNGEIVIGNADWMITCACSAGPAFEGSGIKCGMRASEGAVEYVQIGAGGDDLSLSVIGGGAPAGICGSGLISLLGQFLLCGIVDQSGRFNMELGIPRLVEVDNTRGFVLARGSETRDGRELVITEPDIENLVRTKAAIYAACSLIIANVGITWSDISRVYIAGGFGRYLQAEDAVIIGLLPDIPFEKFTYIGNAALTGAYIALVSGRRRRELAEIAGKMTYVDLSSNTRYMDSYLGAMFLPHTDMAQFPSVAERIHAAKV